MAQKKWSEFAAGSALAGTEIFPGLASGVNKRWTAAQIATYITALITDSAPGTLDTLNELAAALGDDPNFAATMTTALAGKVAKSGDTMTGDLAFGGTKRVIDLASPTSPGHAATKNYVDSGFQPLDADLTAIAALATTSFGLSLLTVADASAARTAIGTPIGTSGAVIPLLNGSNTFSGTQSFTGAVAINGVTVGGSLVRGGSAPIDHTVLSGTSLTPSTQQQSTTTGGALYSSLATNTGLSTCASYYAGKRGDATNLAVASGSRLGEFGFFGADGTNLIGAAGIRCESTAAFTTGAASTRLLFFVANAGAPAAAITVTTTALSPATDNVVSLGLSSTRYSVVYAATGTINTSDARVKQDIGEISDDLLDAWGGVEWKAFRFIEAVAAKGDDARWHMGLIAQQVRDAIDAKLGEGAAVRLGIVCYDAWDAIEEVAEPVMAEREVDGETETYDTGEIEVITPYRPAGDRWGLRYDECFAVEAAWQRRRMDRIEAAVGITLRLD